MNPLDLSLTLPDSYLIGALLGLLWTSIVAALVLLVAELICFLGLMVRAMRSGRLIARQVHLIGPMTPPPAAHPAGPR